jgi:hypothetical protein
MDAQGCADAARYAFGWESLSRNRSPHRYPL